MLSELMCQKSIHAFYKFDYIWTRTWSSILQFSYTYALRPKKIFVTKMVSALALTIFFFFLLITGKMLGGLGKEGNRLRRVERRGGRIRTRRLDSRTAHVPSKDKPGPEKQLSNVFSLLSPSIPGHAQDRSARACACLSPPCPKTHPAGLEGYCYLKTDASLETHTF